MYKNATAYYRIVTAPLFNSEAKKLICYSSPLTLAVFNIFAAMKQFFYTVLIVAGALWGMSSCKNKLAEPPDASIFDIIKVRDGYSIITSALMKTGYDTLLSTSPSVTLFAPHDTAFTSAGYSADRIQGMRLDSLKSLIGYHLVGETITTGNIAARSQLETLYGAYLYTSKSPAGIAYVNNIAITTSYIAAANGVIHPIGKLFTPITKTIRNYIYSDTALSLFRAAVNFDTAVNQLFTNVTNLYTVFAPTNSAFRKAGLTDSAGIVKLGKDSVDKIVKHHYVVGLSLLTNDFVNQGTLTTASDSLLIQVTSLDSIYGKKAPGIKARNRPDSTFYPIIIKDSLALNGIFHRVDSLMLPKTK